MQQCVFLCAHTFYLQLFQACKLSIISKHSMKAPVTFLTSPNEMILCPCDWVGDRDRDTMNKPAGLLSIMDTSLGVMHIVCARFQPQGAVHTELLLNVLRCLDKQPASNPQENKQPIITPSNRGITSCRSTIQKAWSPWLPCCQETVWVGQVDVSEMTETGRGNRGAALLKARGLGAQE